LPIGEGGGNQEIEKGPDHSRPQVGCSVHGAKRDRKGESHRDLVQPYDHTRIQA
jgi:hypothetical protein